MKTLFITFEGIDGSGKDTLLEYCIHLIKQEPEIFGDKYSNIWITREPTKITKSGKTICELLKQNSLSGEDAARLFIKDRIQHSKIIKEVLKHSYVLCSRYDLSTLAYQTAQGLNFEELYKMHKYGKANGTLIPDITVYIRTNPEIAFKRVTERNQHKEVFENLEFQKKLYENYEMIVKKLKEKGRRIMVLNGDNDLNTVKKELKENLIKFQEELTL